MPLSQPPTRSHLRLYTTTPTSHSKHPSSAIFPLHPPGPTIATYAIRHNTASDSENVGLVAGRVWGDEELQTPPPPPAEEGVENAEEGDISGESKDKSESERINIPDQIRRLRNREQEELDLTSPALLLFHVYPTGSTFLEFPPPPPHTPTIVSLLRLPHGHTTGPPHYQPTTIPPSHPPNHILIPLDSDSQILITTKQHTHKLLYQTVEMSIAVPSTSEDNNTGVAIYSTGREYMLGGDDRSWSSEDNGRRKEEGERGEEVEGGLSTPPPGLGGGEVTRILDTPHVHDKQKSKFSDGRSLLEETQGEEIFGGFEPTPDQTTRRLFNDCREENRSGAEKRIMLGDDDVTGDEDEDVIPTMPADPATLPKSDTSGISAPVSFIGTLPPSSGDAGRGSPVGGELLIAKPTPPWGGVEEEQAELPDSLPEAFKVAAEIKKLGHTPPGLKTYGHRRGPPGHVKKQDKMKGEKDEREKQSGEETQELGLTALPKSSPPPSSGIQSNGNAKTQGNERRKGKAAEMEIKESSQLAEEKEQEGISGEGMDVDELDEKEKVSPTAGRRPRLKRPRKEVTAAAAMATPGKRKRAKAQTVEEVVKSGDEDDAPLEEEVEAEEIVEEVVEEVQSVKKKTTLKQKGNFDERKENKKPPKKKARMTSDQAEKEDEGLNTQYTFHGSDEETNEERSEPGKGDGESLQPPLLVKTPAKRGRKPTIIGSTPAKLPPPASTSTPSNHVPKTTSPYSGPIPKIVFSNSLFPDRKDATSILRALGVKKAQKVTEKGVTHLIVGSGGLVRSSKLALALTLGLDILTDSWLLDSYHSPKSELIDTEPYTPSDPSAEQNWGFDLSSAIARGKAGQLCTLLSGYEVIYLTPSLVAHLKQTNQEVGFVDILKATGAGKVLKRAPKGSVEEEGLEVGRGLVFGAAGGEKEGEVGRWREGGWGVFRAEMVTMSILRGRLECGGEFSIEGGAEEKSQGSERRSQVSERGQATPGKGVARGRGGRRKSAVGK